MLNISNRKKRYVISYVLLFVVFILQTTLVQKAAIFSVSPSLLLVLVICFSLINEPVPSATFAVVSGFLLDISFGRVLGFNALLMMYLALGISYVGQDFFRETSRSASFLVILCTIVYETFFSVFNFAIFGESSFWYVLVRVVTVEALYNSIVTFPIYAMCSKFTRIKNGRTLFD